MADIKQKLEAALAQAVRDGKIPHAVVAATNADGSFTYSHATGPLQIGNPDSAPITTGALFMLASQTKLLTVLSMLKAVELGLIQLDDDVVPHLPELAALKIIEGFDANGAPILKERTKTITLRILLTHSSGLGYPTKAPLDQYAAYAARTGPPLDRSAATIATRCALPLLFEPGTSFMYGYGLDWAGLLLHRISSLPLDQFMTKHILEPLNISPSDITFFPTPAQRPEIPTLAERSPPTPTSPLIPNTAPSINTFSTDPFGGHGAYARLPAYIRILQSLLPNPTHASLLPPHLLSLLFTSQLTPASRAALQPWLSEAHTRIPGEQDAAAAGTVRVDWSLAGMLYLSDDPSAARRKAGSLSWGGMCNTFWLVDREADLALTFATQVIPSGDAGVKEVIGVVERAVYEMAGVKF